MSPERARWLLEHPLTDPQPEAIADYRSVEQTRYGLLTTVLAVDR